ncbi:MAG: TetR/AcrR family transcriptional regulator [Caulobacter sp.]|nr:TetR/AcrR family transcriptional regulator [Caulobacter sp.]
MPSGKGVPKGDKRERTKAALVEAAAELIAEKGFDRASLDAICARAGMTRGAFHGNFKNRDELFLAVIDRVLKPVSADFRPGASLRVQLRILGLAVAAEARRRAPMAATAAAFQLYLLTNETARANAAERQAAGYRAMADGFARLLPPGSLPMPADRFVKTIDALITGMMYVSYQSPGLLTDEDFVAAFEALAGPEAKPTRDAMAGWPMGRQVTIR